MNRKERRKLERKGVIAKREPIYNMKMSDLSRSRLTPTAETAMLSEINRQILEKDLLYTLDMDSMVLWTLHKKFGWGYTRLRRFYEEAFKEHLRMREHYEMNDTYPERVKLKEEVGVDVEAWYHEFFNLDGSYKIRVTDERELT